MWQLWRFGYDWIDDNNDIIQIQIENTVSILTKKALVIVSEQEINNLLPSCFIICKIGVWKSWGM